VPLLAWAGNSLFITLVVTTGRVFFDSLAGYALSRLHFRGRTIIFAALVAVMAVPNVVLLIPRFLILKELGLYNSYAGMIIPIMIDAAGIFIMKQFFESIPPSVEEAARIDGAGTFRIFWSIVLPMAKPAVITLTILAFQGSWNELPHFIIATDDPKLFTLTRGVAQLTSGGLGSGNFNVSAGATLNFGGARTFTGQIAQGLR
jgi:multiple sugar transport system permease protein